MRKRHAGFGLAAAALVNLTPAWATPIPTLSSFTPGNLVVSVYGSVDGNSYSDNQASPIALQEISTSGSILGQILLPQTPSVVNGVQNSPISGEYGSSSEGSLQLSVDGHFLTIAGYGVQASTFDANQSSYGGGTKSCIGGAPCYPLAQTSSVAGTASSGPNPVVVVPRVVALVGANGSVDTSTALTGVFNENNPRSVATVNGSSFYISGQGLSKTDTTTQGLFLAQRGATTATPIDTSFDTRSVEIQKGQLFLSSDSTEGSGVHENISSYSAPGTLPTSASTATILPNLKSKFTYTSTGQLNVLDTTLAAPSKQIYLSPEDYFFANATTLYVADSGNPKGDNNGPGKTTQGLSDGGLQKWVFNGTSWNLEYTLSAGLNLVPDTTPCAATQVAQCGTTGLIGLTGVVVGNTVELFATNSTLGDLDNTYLYGITDLLDATTNPGESFTQLLMAAPGTNIRGVAFAPSPIPEPLALSLFAAGLVGIAAARRRART